MAGRGRRVVGVVALALWALGNFTRSVRVAAADVELVAECDSCCGDATADIAPAPSEKPQGYQGCVPRGPLEPDDGHGAVMFRLPGAKYTSATFPITTYPTSPSGTVEGWKFDPPTMTYVSYPNYYEYHGSYRRYDYS